MYSTGGDTDTLFVKDFDNNVSLNGENNQNDELSIQNQERHSRTHELSYKDLKSVSQCLRSIRFWQYISILILTNFFNTYFNFIYKNYGGLNGIGDKVLSWAASLGGICSCIARILLGKLMDKYGFKKLYAILLVL